MELDDKVYRKESDDEPMIKAVINDCYGGFGLSEKAINYIIDKYPKYRKGTPEFLQHYQQHGKHLTIDEFDERIKSSYYFEWDRTNLALIDAVETLGNEANTNCSKLKIIKFHQKYENYYTTHEYDGLESFGINYFDYIRDEIVNNDELDDHRKIKLIKQITNKS